MYIKVNENAKKITHIKVETYYSKGGYSYFTYKSEPRGYYVRVTPVERWTREGVTLESYTMFRGYKHFIQEANRFNKSTLAKLDDKTLENTRDIIARVLEEEGLTLAETPETAWTNHINGIKVA